MARYAFESPHDWRRMPSVAPWQTVVYLREPPGTERAAILLLSPIAPTHPLDEQLAATIDETCADVDILERSPITELSSVAFEGKMMAVRLDVTRDGVVHDERRIYTMFDTGSEYLCVVFIGGPLALPVHQFALEPLLRSIRPMDEPDDPGPDAGDMWTE